LASILALSGLSFVSALNPLVESNTIGENLSRSEINLGYETVEKIPIFIPTNAEFSLVDFPRINLTRFPFSGRTNNAIAVFDYYGQEVTTTYHMTGKSDGYHKIEIVRPEESSRLNSLISLSDERELDAPLFIPTNYRFQIVDRPGADFTRFPFGGPTDNIIFRYTQGNDFITATYRVSKDEDSDFHDLELVNMIIDD
jgi:hypothetical protein